MSSTPVQEDIYLEDLVQLEEKELLQFIEKFVGAETITQWCEVLEVGTPDTWLDGASRVIEWHRTQKRGAETLKRKREESFSTSDEPKKKKQKSKEEKEKKKKKKKSPKRISPEGVPLPQLEVLAVWEREAELEFVDRDTKGALAFEFEVILRVARLQYCLKKAIKKEWPQVVNYLVKRQKFEIENRLATLVCALKHGWAAAGVFANGAGRDKIERKNAKIYKNCVSLASKSPGRKKKQTNYDREDNRRYSQGYRSRREDTSRSFQPRTPRSCYTCGFPGHLAAQCPNNQNQQRPAAPPRSRD